MHEQVEPADHGQFVIDRGPLERPTRLEARFRCEDIPISRDIQLGYAPPLKASLLAETQPICQLICVAAPGFRRTSPATDDAQPCQKGVRLEFPPHLGTQE